MPINIPMELPAHSVLEEENIFVMSEERAIHQDIRPLKIAIVNLMPTKIATEIQLLRLLGNSPLQVDITLIKAEHHISKNTSQEHLARFYTTFAKIEGTKFDGMIITGAPVEQLSFEKVTYWDELCRIMDYSRINVFSTLYVCWGAHAGLYHHYGVKKHILSRKLSGVFKHRTLDKTHSLFRGFDDTFFMPHSRNSEVKQYEVEQIKELKILASSHDAGVAIMQDKSNRQFYILGHFEYDAMTLAQEYFRDQGRGIDADVPKNYFENNDPSGQIHVNWRAHANLFFSNWLNFFVYQNTPFEVSTIGKN